MTSPNSSPEDLGFSDPDEFDNFDNVDSTTITEAPDDFSEKDADFAVEGVDL